VCGAPLVLLDEATAAFLWVLFLHVVRKVMSAAARDSALLCTYFASTPDEQQL
jgi:hypothetical protein